jgi:hypothetical protein
MNIMDCTALHAKSLLQIKPMAAKKVPHFSGPYMQSRIADGQLFVYDREDHAQGQ